MMGQDLKFTLRQFQRSPAYVLVTVLSLAIGIGAATTVFSGLNALLLRPSPGVAQPETLVSIYTGSADEPYGSNSLPDFEDWVEQADVLESAALFTVDVVTLGDGEGRRA
ncbi:MAG TPA: permease, partial [Acidobacteriota bacterium]|nr:permease [Acidobacteriota bacterium]